MSLAPSCAALDRMRSTALTALCSFDCGNPSVVKSRSVIRRPGVARRSGFAGSRRSPSIGPTGAGGGVGEAEIDQHLADAPVRRSLMVDCDFQLLARDQFPLEQYLTERGGCGSGCRRAELERHWGTALPVTRFVPGGRLSDQAQIGTCRDRRRSGMEQRVRLY